MLCVPGVLWATVGELHSLRGLLSKFYDPEKKSYLCLWISKKLMYFIACSFPVDLMNELTSSRTVSMSSNHGWIEESHIIQLQWCGPDYSWTKKIKEKAFNKSWCFTGSYKEGMNVIFSTVEASLSCHTSILNIFTQKFYKASFNFKTQVPPLLSHVSTRSNIWSNIFCFSLMVQISVIH